jgi:hypothetical protein
MGTNFYAINDSGRQFICVNKFYALRTEYEERGPLRARDLLLRERPELRDVWWVRAADFRVVDENEMDDYEERGYHDLGEPKVRENYAAFGWNEAGLVYVGLFDTNARAWELARSRKLEKVMVLHCCWDGKTVTATIPPKDPKDPKEPKKPGEVHRDDCLSLIRSYGGPCTCQDL